MNEIPDPPVDEATNPAPRADDLHRLAESLEELLRSRKSVVRGWLVSFLLKCLPPAEPFPSDNLDDVIACVRDTDLQLRHDADEARKMYVVPDGKPDDVWIFFKSPAATWKTMGGRAGWLVLCAFSLRQKAFFITAMN